MFKVELAKVDNLDVGVQQSVVGELLRAIQDDIVRELHLGDVKLATRMSRTRQVDPCAGFASRSALSSISKYMSENSRKNLNPNSSTVNADKLYSFPPNFPTFLQIVIR